MPRAEANDSTPKGQPYGQRARQQEFLTATKPAKAAPAPERAAAKAAPAPERAAGVPANVGVDTNMQDLLDVVTGPTDRPDEPVTLGLEAFQGEELEAVREWFPVLQELAADPDAPNIVKETAARAALKLGL